MANVSRVNLIRNDVRSWVEGPSEGRTMRGLLLIVALTGIARIAHADGFPTSGPCDDIESCEKACKAGKKDTCYWGGVLALQGTGEDRKVKGRDLFNRACTKGDADGCYQVARIDAQLPMDDDKTRAKVRGEFDKACTKGHARACFMVVQMLISGLGESEPDAKTKKLATAAQGKGLKVLEQRCIKQKQANACDWAASLYAGTAFTKADPKKATDLKERGCQIRTKAPCPPPAPPPPPPGRPMGKPAVKKGADTPPPGADSVTERPKPPEPTGNKPDGPR